MKRCDVSGDIYKKAYEGLYCVGCEKFLTERDMADGKCLIHGKEPVLLKEENYFFRFSKYQDKILEYLSFPNVIVPEWRREEAINFVKGGLEDFSISREKERLSWGVPVPGDDTQVMYVWFDALTNYISTLGWPSSAEAAEGKSNLFNRFWEEGHTLQLAGKDQIRFQSLMWQAMLMSAGIKGTDQVFYHGFINSAGQKMSKSIGNVISPYELVEKYGTEATRYLLLRHVHPFDDTDITWERLDEWYEAGLVNGLGNIVARVMKLAETHLPNAVERPAPEDNPFLKEYTDALDTYELQKAADYVWSRIQTLDREITETEPFKVVKVDIEKGKELIAAQVTELYLIARLLNPFLPHTSEVIKESILANKKPENLFPRLTQ